jgi:Protein of unknown function (DUF3823) N-terminal domain/Domain of unknown function (DUF3823_C)
MKHYILSILSVACLLVAGCTKDNKDAPSAFIKGTVKYGDQPVGLRSNGVQLELWQYGYQLLVKIPVYIAQDGTYSANVFDGNYKLTMLRGNGPWADRTDSIDIKVSGSINVDMPVDPYFVISNPSFQRDGNMINASFTVRSINTTKTLELVRLYVGQTIITDQNNSAGSVSKTAAAIPDLSQPVSLSVAIPASLAAKKSVFVRLGVKTTGVAELMYSAPQEIMIN